MKLILPATLSAQIAREARALFPRECCGLIEGVWHGDEAHVLALHPAPNRAPEADAFVIDPVAHLAAQKAARAKGHVLIGCYHSHPNGRPLPSAADKEGGGEENFIWLIAVPPDLRAFVYSAGGFVGIGLATGADLVTSSSKERN